MNTDLQNLKLHFLRLVSNAVFIKNIENVKKKKTKILNLMQQKQETS